jgi:hypothetical protein
MKEETTVVVLDASAFLWGMTPYNHKLNSTR